MFTGSMARENWRANKRCCSRTIPSPIRLARRKRKITPQIVDKEGGPRVSKTTTPRDSMRRAVTRGATRLRNSGACTIWTTAICCAVRCAAEQTSHRSIGSFRCAWEAETDAAETQSIAVIAKIAATIRSVRGAMMTARIPIRRYHHRVRASTPASPHVRCPLPDQAEFHRIYP